MTALLHFEDKVHRKGLARAESTPLLMPRTTKPGPGEFRISRGAPYRKEDQMPSGPDHGARHGDADFFSPPAAGPGGGSR